MARMLSMDTWRDIRRALASGDVRSRAAAHAADRIEERLEFTEYDREHALAVVALVESATSLPWRWDWLNPLRIVLRVGDEGTGHGRLGDRVTVGWGGAPGCRWDHVPAEEWRAAQKPSGWKRGTYVDLVDQLPGMLSDQTGGCDFGGERR